MTKVVLKWQVVMVLALVPFVLAMVHASQRDSQGSRLTALDYAEIQQLYARYAHSIDTGNAAMFTSVFTPDGVLIDETPNGAGTFRGHAELAALATRGRKSPANMTHVITNILINPSPEGATGSAYLLTVRSGEAGQPAVTAASGIYRHAFVRTPEGWRVKEQRFSPRSRE
jgi:hypothetical protein